MIRRFRQIIYIFLLTALAGAAAEEEILEKTIARGLSFTIQIYTEDNAEVFLLSKIDSNFLSNVSSWSSNGSSGFVLNALKSGTTDLTIDRVSKTVEKDFLRYRILILPGDEKPTNQVRIKKDGKKAGGEEASDEKKQVEMIRRFFRDGYDANALEYIAEYEKKYKGGAYAMDAALIKSRILTNQKKYTEAAKSFQDFYNDNKSKLAGGRAGEALANMALFYLAAGATNRAVESWQRIRTFHTNSVAFIEALWQLGEVFYKQKKFESALECYENIYTALKNSGSGSENPLHLDQAVLRLGNVYENSPDHMDLQKALTFYELLPQLCPWSDLISEAEEQARFVKVHFIDVR